MVREYVEISGCNSIEALIARLEAVKAEMPSGSTEPEVRLRGDDVFGRHVLVTYSRPETEAELETARRAREFASSWFKAPLARCART
jgi:hypothetical protein